MKIRHISLTPPIVALAAMSFAATAGAYDVNPDDRPAAVPPVEVLQDDTGSADTSAPDATTREASTGLAAQLRRQLDKKGWRAYPADDGSVYYLPPAPVVAAPKKSAPPAPAPKPSLADQLRNELESKGWIATRAADGSVYYLPPPVQQRLAPPARETDTAATAASQLHEELRSLGWRTVPADDGGVYYLPPANRSVTQPATPPEVKAETAHPPVTSAGAIGTAADVSPASVPPAATETTATRDAKTAAPKAEGEAMASPQAVMPRGSAEETGSTEAPPEATDQGMAEVTEAAESNAADPAATSAQRYRQPPRYPYGWSPYGHPGYMPAYPPQPQWQPRYRPAPPWYSRPR